MLPRSFKEYSVTDVLINNAGIAVAGYQDRVPQNRWEMLLKLRFFAPKSLTRLFLPKILERGNGDIVKISSWVGWVDALNLSAYAASKFGLRGFGESLAVETAKRNVQVPNVYPSFSRTPILDSEQIGMVERKLVPIT
jgi:short-subunit dehydrogenase